MLPWILVSLFISTITLAIAMQRRDAPKSGFFILLTLAIIAYNLGRAFEITADNLQASYFGVILAYIGLPYIPAIMLFFLLDYYEIKINKKPLLLLWVPLVLTSLFVTVPALRHCYYAEYSFSPGPPIAQITVEGTAYYYAMFVYHLVLNIICLSLSLWGAINSNKNQRWSSILVFVAVLLPMLGEILYVLRLTPMQMEIAPIALCFSIACLCIAVYRLNLLRILPAAKAAILEQLSDSFIIVDLEHRYLEANAAAKKRFTALENLQIGETLDMAALFPNATEGLDGRMLITIPTQSETRYYHLTETMIEDKGKKCCICYTLHNVTDTRKLMAELKTMATYDVLTGIYNRATFYRLATEELERAAQQRTSVAAIGIDIDRFKEVNDTYSHLGGDAVIRGIAQRVADRLRTADIFGRLGGDEFTILLPNTTLQNAVSLAEDLQRIINMKPFTYEGKHIATSISIGVAVYDPKQHEDLEQLLADADSAMYTSKKAGRNTVSAHQPAL